MKTLTVQKQKLQEEHKIGGNYGQGRGQTYDEIATRNAELETEVKSLRAMQTEVVKYNRSLGTFEFIGTPQHLTYGARKSPATVADVVNAIREWLEKNPRLSFREVFRSLDKGNFGDLKESDFLQAFQRIGVLLTSEEIRLLKQKLDLKANNLFEIAPLMRVISGIPTKQFLPLSLIKLAVFVKEMDWTKDDADKKIDARKRGSFEIDEFKSAIQTLTSSAFVMDHMETEELFAYITKMPREKWVTARLNMSELIPQVFEAIDANIIEDVRLALREKKLHLMDVLRRHDSNNDGELTLNEVQNMLHELGVALSAKT